MLILLLMFATLHHFGITRSSARHDAYCNFVLPQNRTALMQAAYNGHTKTVQAILSHPNLQINMQTEVCSFLIRTA